MLLYLREVPFLRILKGTIDLIYPTFYPTQKKELIISSFFSQLSAQDRNNDILLRYTNKRKNVRIATYTHVFLCLNIILAEQTSR